MKIYRFVSNCQLLDIINLRKKKKMFMLSRWMDPAVTIVIEYSDYGVRFFVPA